MQYKYLCIRSKQTTSDKWLVQFAAPASEIDRWAGVPQKKRFDLDGDSVGESVGFQRGENAERVNSLREFYSNPENIIQNPILCSLRTNPQSSVQFQPASEPHRNNQATAEIGELTIDVPDFSQLPIGDCIKYVREYIEQRVPALRGHTPNAAMLRALKIRAADKGYIQPEQADSLSATVDDDIEPEPDAQDNGDATGVLFEDSHIKDFWEELAARDELASQIDLSEADSFLGFTREALLSYLKPIVLVDGQHRLRGAIAAAEESLNMPDIQSEVEDRIVKGETPESVEAAIINREARALPVSLLMSIDPEEQVFQFVVVNQKATPIGRALLGTIVSTTLSNDEMAKVAKRLKDAGIKVEESQAITFLARHRESPFRDRVERGLAGDQNALQWNVFASLVGVFRHLKGGKLFGERNDYADLWRSKFLPTSGIVAGFRDQDYDTPLNYWAKLDGPWRAVFMEFWSEVRDTFGNVDDPDKPNYWGRPRDSNLFNKVSLTILAADFFQFLHETRTELSSTQDIRPLVKSWLENVNSGYFDKDWNLAGVKKDSVGIRNQWALIWSDYRKSGGKLPAKRLFRQPRNL